jgi:hypothetical protein
MTDKAEMRVGNDSLECTASRREFLQQSGVGLGSVALIMARRRRSI